MSKHKKFRPKHSSFGLPACVPKHIINKISRLIKGKLCYRISIQRGLPKEVREYYDKILSCPFTQFPEPPEEES